MPNLKKIFPIDYAAVEAAVLRYYCFGAAVPGCFTGRFVGNKVGTYRGPSTFNMQQLKTAMYAAMYGGSMKTVAQILSSHGQGSYTLVINDDWEKEFKIDNSLSPTIQLQIWINVREDYCTQPNEIKPPTPDKKVFVVCRLIDNWAAGRQEIRINHPDLEIDSRGRLILHTDRPVSFLTISADWELEVIY